MKSTATIRRIHASTTLALAFMLTTPPLHAATILATQTGPINASTTWGAQAVPTAGDANVWDTAGYRMTHGSETFHGGLLSVKSGAILAPAAGAILVLQATTFDNGEIRKLTNIPSAYDFSGKTLTFASGGAAFSSDSQNRNIALNNAVWAGSGNISFTKSGTIAAGASVLTLGADNTLSGYTGTISLANTTGDGTARLTIDAATTGSFGVNIGTGSLLDVRDETKTYKFSSLVLGGETIAAGTYAYGDFSATQQNYLLTDGTPGMVNVIPEPATLDLTVSFIPVTDGNPATDSNGYAGSAINSIVFAKSNLITIGDQQFISYYRRHATDPIHPDNDTVVIARRTLGESLWEIFPTDFMSVNIDDTHNVISMAIDGNGVLHMSWGMHADNLRYGRSTGSVLGESPIEMTSLGSAGMNSGSITSVTYPMFQTLPDGDVVFLFRRIATGRGDWYLNRYDHDTDTWAPVHTNASGARQPLMQGTWTPEGLDGRPDNSFYPDRLTLGPDGMLHLAGVFRYQLNSPAGELRGYQTNHRYAYLRSPDGGTSWQRSDGSPIGLPVVEAGWFMELGGNHVPEIVKDIPEGHSLMNMSGMTTDRAGRPVIANWWADEASTGDHTRQYHIFFHDGTEWHQRTVSARDIDNPATKYKEVELKDSRMGRPMVLTDAEDRIIVIYNDNRFDGITAVFSLPLAQDPGRNHWTRMNLTRENLGDWEPTYDGERWKRDGVLHMLYQKLPGMGMSYGSQNNSTPVSVIEWDARAYFNGPIRLRMDTQSTPGQAAFSALTRIGFRHDLRTSTDLDFSAQPAVSLPGDGTWRDLGIWPMNEAVRFWRLDSVEEATNNL